MCHIQYQLANEMQLIRCTALTITLWDLMCTNCLAFDGGRAQLMALGGIGVVGVSGGWWVVQGAQKQEHAHF